MLYNAYTTIYTYKHAHIHWYRYINTVYNVYSILYMQQQRILITTTTTTSTAEEWIDYSLYPTPLVNNKVLLLLV